MEITFYLGSVMINKGNNVLVVEDTTIKGEIKVGKEIKVLRKWMKSYILAIMAPKPSLGSDLNKDLEEVWLSMVIDI